MLAEAVTAFRADFQEAQRQAGVLEAEVATFFGRADGDGSRAGGGAPIADVGKRQCTGALVSCQPFSNGET